MYIHENIMYSIYPVKRKLPEYRDLSFKVGQYNMHMYIHIYINENLTIRKFRCSFYHRYLAERYVLWNSTLIIDSIINEVRLCKGIFFSFFFFFSFSDNFTVCSCVYQSFLTYTYIYMSKIDIYSLPKVKIMLQM